MFSSIYLQVLPMPAVQQLPAAAPVAVPVAVLEAVPLPSGIVDSDAETEEASSEDGSESAGTPLLYESEGTPQLT